MVFSSSNNSEDLKDLSQLIQEEPLEKEVKLEVKESEIFDEYGGITEMAMVGINLTLELMGLTELTPAQKEKFKAPAVKIETQYAPLLISKYAGKAAPFVELALVLGSILREKQREFQEKHKQADAPAVDQENANS